MLGEQYVGLEAGGDEDNLKNGDKITQTQDAIVLEKMISQFLFSKASETKSDSKEPEVKAVAGVKASGGKATTKAVELGDPGF